jgi:hypothetical protein
MVQLFRGDRLDQINAVLQNGKLESIGPAPAFELVNQIM